MNKIKKEINLHSDFKVFIFGSVLKTSLYNDIDILILYNNQTITITKLLQFRNSIKVFYYNQYNLILDISLLSYFENAEMNFLSKIEYIEIKQRG